MKKIILTIIIIVMATVQTYGAVRTKYIYSIDEDYIDLTELSINIKDYDEYIPFEDAVKSLKKEMDDTGTVGAAKTSVYFENGEDFKENILRVDIDFTGKTLPRPVNTILAMDQSGSMNMTSGQATHYAITPCLQENHAYLMRINIDGVIYHYYHFPTESEWTGDWLTGYRENTAIMDEAKAHAISEGVATADSVVKPVTVYFFPKGSQFHHYDYVGTGDLSDANRVYIETAVKETDINKNKEINENFKHIDREIFHKTAPTSVWEFYSPITLNTTVSAELFFENATKNNDCYDRMAMAKTVFHELSENALKLTENTVGYANFAAGLHSSQVLGKKALKDEFLNTTGTRGTAYEIALNFARDEFNDANTENPQNQNMLIMVSDGAPNGTLNEEEEFEQYMQGTVGKTGFLEETNAIVYYIGIDMPDELFDTWGSAIATVDSNGNKHMINSSNAATLLEAKAELERILTETTNLNTNIQEDFHMTVGSNYPVTVQYILDDSGDIITESADTVEQLEHLGITYNKETGEVNWDTGNRGITSARMSFYKKFDESKVDWDNIKGGGSQAGISLGESSTSYIDYTGVPREILMDDTASYIVENHSKLRIENTTSTEYNVVVGERIDYKITVSNDGVLDSDNNFVYQKIPEGTKYFSSEGGTYYEEENLLKFEIPVLASGEVKEFHFSVIAAEYDFEIISQAKLGVYDESVTLNDDGTPILSAEFLYHHTPVDDGLVNTGDIDLGKYVILATISTGAILLILNRRRKIAQ